MKNLLDKNEEILENFFNEMQKMLYCKTSLQSKRKMLYSAKYWAFYFLRLNRNLIEARIRK
jgi:hypothetical protein